jgi:hypothetical protein
MEPLENAKEPVDKVHVKPHAIVSDKKDIFTSILPASYLDLGAGRRVRVNLTALEMRLKSTSFSSDSSPWTTGSSASFHVMSRPIVSSES